MLRGIATNRLQIEPEPWERRSPDRHNAATDPSRDRLSQRAMPIRRLALPGPRLWFRYLGCLPGTTLCRHFRKRSNAARRRVCHLAPQVRQTQS